MFFARVMIGNFKEMASDSNLRLPPKILNHPKGLNYNSVKGHTNGSDVYMVYENSLAYPEYLITYK
jgi:hypothetical protein